MKTVKPIVLILSFFVTTCAFAQDYNYFLKDYFNPDYQRQALVFEFSGGLNSYSTAIGYNISGMESLELESSDILNFNGIFGVGYNRTKNSLKTQSTTYLGYTLSGGFDKTENYDRRVKKSNFGTGINFEHFGRYYNTTSKQFFLIAPTFGLLYNYDNTETDYETTYSYEHSIKNFQTGVSVRLGGGLGRIEEVGDARQAIYILQELQKQNLLKKEFSTEQINELAQLITVVKNKRQLDSRIKLIEEITAVDSFFVANGFVDKDHSTAYFTTLYDNWQYANVSRRSGDRLTFGINPFGQYADARDNVPYDDLGWAQPNIEAWNFGGDIFASFESEKPINLQWQQGFFAESTLGLNREIDNGYAQNIYSTTLRAAYGLGFYPNSRTEIKGRISQGVNYLWNKDNAAWVLNTALNFDMYYYFSPQFRLSLSYRLGFDYQEESYKSSDDSWYLKNKYPTNILSFGLVYALF